MALVAFVLAAVEFALIAFGVDFPQESGLENVAAGLFLLTLGFLLPGALSFYASRQG